MGVFFSFSPIINTNTIQIASSDATRKIPYVVVRACTFEPIVGDEGYSIFQLRLGSNENDVMSFYFVPTQYCRSLRDIIMMRINF